MPIASGLPSSISCAAGSAVAPTARTASSSPTPTADDEVVTARLDAVVATQDGFELAEKDLELRREGELLGLTQSGLPPLRIATLADPDDQRRSVRARGVAEALVDEAGILRPGHEALAHEMTAGWLRRVGAGEALAAAGETDDDA